MKEAAGVASTFSKVLDLDQVKALAREENYTTIFFNEKSRVISFQKLDQIDDSVRINVYWTTGTVGTCLNHPRQGKTQLFRRDVDVSGLREIFRNPRVHTGVGYYEKEKVGKADLRSGSSPFIIGDRVHVEGYADATVVSDLKTSGCYARRIEVRYDDGQTFHVKPDDIRLSSVCNDLEMEAKQQLKRLEAELELIQSEKMSCTAIVESFEQARERERIRKEEEEKERRLRMKRKAEADAEELRSKLRKLEEARIDLERINRGNSIKFSLCESDHVYSCFSEKVVSMACGGQATILLYENGGWAWTSGLPKLLHNKLKGRQRSLPSPVYVAMGSQDRYYIKFADGKSEWVGCDEMGTELKSNSRTVKTVAFGEYWDSFFIVYTDGCGVCKHIPTALLELLRTRQSRADLECVSLGPDGEYFLSAKNGRAWWGGLTHSNIDSIKEVRDRIKFMDFGDGDSYFVRYS
ncbi:hypothetical protein ACHAXS_011127 [Conticribra weissflogii]